MCECVNTSYVFNGLKCMHILLMCFASNEKKTGVRLSACFFCVFNKLNTIIKGNEIDDKSVIGYIIDSVDL